MGARLATFDRTQQKQRSGRARLIAKVHVAKKDLGLDEDTYRAALVLVTGKDSSANMTETELTKVIAHMADHGFVTKVRAADHPSARKARALWISLHQLGVVHNRSEQALEAFAAKQLGCEKMQWMRQSDCYRLIEALKDMAERNGWPQRGPNGEKLTVEQLQAGLQAAIAAKAAAA